MSNEKDTVITKANITMMEPSYDDLFFDPTVQATSMPGCDIERYRNALIRIRDYQSESMSAADLQIIAEKALEDD